MLLGDEWEAKVLLAPRGRGLGESHLQFLWRGHIFFGRCSAEASLAVTVSKERFAAPCY